MYIQREREREEERKRVRWSEVKEGRNGQR